MTIGETMGLLKNIFKKTVNKKTFVRNWSNKEFNRIQNDDKVNCECLFISMMYSLSGFSALGDSDSILDELDDIYENDTVLFEVGCYFFVLVDSWLLSKKPEFRNEMTSYFGHRFVELFSEALNLDNIKELFFQRTNKYRELITINESVENHVVELVLRSARDVPTNYSFSSNEAIEIDAIKNIVVKVRLNSFIEHIVPGYLQSLKNVFNLLDTTTTP